MIAVLDVGSNSVRLMLWQDGKTLYKTNTITALGEGIAYTNRITQDAISRTIDAISTYANEAKSRGATTICIFATEAVRSATNGAEFCARVRETTGLDVDVLDGATEAKIGFYGAYQCGTCCVVDIGGASTEIIVGNKKRISYSKSIGIGVVKIKNVCAEDENLMAEYIDKKIAEYGEVPNAEKIVAIGGTAGTLVAITKKMKEYDPKAVDKSILSRDEIHAAAQLIAKTPLSRRGEIVGLPINRADVMLGGAILLEKIMEKLGFNYCLVSESDNLEGYAMKLSKKASANK